MAINATNLATYTDEEMVKIYRCAVANMAMGQTRRADGKEITFADVEKMLKVLNEFEARIARAGDESGGVALGIIGRQA
jgi:hypothetical protein